MVDGILVAYTIGMAMGLLIGVSIAILVDKASRRREAEMEKRVEIFMAKKDKEKTEIEEM